MSLAYLSFGSNLGDRVRSIEWAYQELDKRSFGTVLRKSPFYETDPVGCAPGTQPFVNAVAEVMTDLTPQELLEAVHAIEADAGRARVRDKNAPRVLDIDLLLYDYNVLQIAGGLTLPHPEMTNRLFILKPLCDVRPDLLHPVHKRTVLELLEAAPESVKAQRIKQL